MRLNAPKLDLGAAGSIRLRDRLPRAGHDPREALYGRAWSRIVQIFSASTLD
jgi:hypothetical protein